MVIVIQVLNIVRWKQFGVFAIWRLLLTFFISCNTPSPNLKTKEIEFWTIQLQPQLTNFFNQLIVDFEADNPGLYVRWVDVPWSAWKAKFRVLF